MSEYDATPTLTFSTRTNTELGAQGVELADDGTILLIGVLKKVTESMLTSYPRELLGTWTPNRSSIAYPRDEIMERRIKSVSDGKELDLDAILALAS
jgi:hypothetical protein